ncbi:MAG: hypothetical protein M3N16_03895 [Actinomycetota bacterium]|nr:hypothetical protein [Actinomycetota bacterium]
MPASHGRRSGVLALLAAAVFVVSSAIPALAPGELGPSPAHAGQYTVTACDSAPGFGVNAWGAYANDTYMTVGVRCPSGGDDKGLISRDRVGGPVRAYDGAKAQWSGVAPAGTNFAELHYIAHGYRQQWTGHSANSSVWDVGVFAGWGGDPFAAEELLAGCRGLTVCRLTDYGIVPEGHPAGWRGVNLAGRQSVRFMARCRHSSECYLGGGTIGARLAVQAANLVVNDLWQPGIGITGGSVTGGGWKTGDLDVGFSAWDNTGIQAFNYRIDGGAWRQHDGRHCDYTRMVPCSNQSGRFVFGTAGLSDGHHVVEVVTADAGHAPNHSSASHGFHVDNHAPDAAKDLAVEGGSGWRSQNGFRLSWTAPGQDGGSPIEAIYQVCNVGSGACSEARADGAGATTVNLPEAGEYTVRVAMRDALRGSAWSDPVTLRYDGTAPGLARPKEANGWLSAAELPGYEQVVELERGVKVPPSGIRGYAITTDGSEPGTAVTHEGNPARFKVDHLGEGVHTIKARAISNAGVASSEVGSTVLRLDLSRPDAKAEGLPTSEWSREPVRLALTGIDQPGLSGMDAAKADEPVENGGYLRYRVDGGELQKAPGGRVDLELKDDGEHVVSFEAVDLAGNVSRDETVRFKIDATAPETVAFEAHDASDPRKVTVVASDRGSGIASGVIEIRRAGTGDWRALDTRREGERFLAYLNEDELDRSASYELRARVRDIASNEAVGDRRVDGSAAVVPGSLRAGTRVSAGGVTRATYPKACKQKKARKGRKGKKRRKKPRRKSCGTVEGPEQITTSLEVPFGKDARVVGRLTDESGRPLAGAVVDVQARLKTPGADLRPEGAVRTDSAGGFEYRAPAGAGRMLRLLYAGTNIDRPSFSDMEVRVSGGLTLKVNKRRARNRQSVRFSGQLLGGPVPSGGVKLNLEAFYRGRWRTFATPRVDQTGAWTYAYRFGGTRGKVTYPFRATLVPEAAYPYERGYSNQVTVTVRGR